jgi:hypothetical protein
MTAHLRTSAYGERKNSSGANLDYARGEAAAVRARSFLNLGHEYDRQARSNFAREAPLFAIITAIAVAWPMIYSLRLLSGAS